MVLDARLAHIQKLRTVFQAEGGDVSDPAYAARQLQHMADIDQLMITLGMDHGAYDDDPDAAAQNLRDAIKTVMAGHVIGLKAILKHHDWQALSRMDGHAFNNAWLLVQHADDDPGFQSEVLAQLEAQHLHRTESYAYLYDRVAINTGRPQRYGTQFNRGDPYPIEDPAGLEQRRRDAGIRISMDEYRQVMAEYHARIHAPKPR